MSIFDMLERHLAHAKHIQVTAFLVPFLSLLCHFHHHLPPWVLKCTGITPAASYRPNHSPSVHIKEPARVRAHLPKDVKTTAKVISAY